MKPRDGAMMILLGAIWGTSFLLIRIAAPALGPLVLVTARMIIAGSTLLLFAAATHQPLPSLRTAWKPYLILGLANALLPLTLEAFAVMHLNASLAAVLATTAPLFTALAAVVWLRERLTWQKGVGLLLGLGGVLLLVGGSPLPVSRMALLGVGASLLSALLYAIGTIYARGVLHTTSPLPLVIGQEFVAGIAVLPLAWLTLPASRLSSSVIAATLTLALVMTAGGNLLYFRLIRRVGPTAAQSVSFLVPAFALLAGVLVLQEPFTVGMLLGLVVIALSIVLVTDVYVHLQLPVRATFASATTAVTGRMHRRYVAPSGLLAWSGRVAAMPGTPRSFGADDVPVYDRHSTRVRPVRGQPAAC